MIFPYRAKNPPENFPIVTIVLIVLNIAIFAATSDGWMIREDIAHLWGLKSTNIGQGTMFTSMFLHADWFHLLGNMWFLYLFGFAVEGKLKWLKFIILYLAAGVGGDLLYMAMASGGSGDIPGIGASGAIMGLLGASLWMFPHGKINVFYWFGIVWIGVWEWPIWGAALYYLGLDVIGAMLQLSLFDGGGTNHLAHIGGALGGFLCALLLRVKRDDEYVSEAKSTLAEAKDLSMLTRIQLRDMCSVQPDDSLLAHHWMYKSQQSPPVTDECIQHFMKHLPNIVREGDGASAAACVAGLIDQGTVFDNKVLLDCAGAAEKSGATSPAIKLLTTIRNSQHATSDDLETATFRLASIYEQWMNNPHKALELFQEYQHRWPMSPMESVVRQKISVLTQKVQQAPRNPY
ncbi:MAG: rhomboid family intramembrane serine protease [Armatimonadetes bacterium]|nr:rhomboid family intramembrane serine protease [Armatimonadota bacterium]